jgi:PAS domain S-box-containing protein
LGDAVLVIDASNYSITDVNQAAEKQYKLTRQELVGKTCHQITHNCATPCQDAKQPCPVRKALENMDPFTVEHQHVHSKNNAAIMEITAIPLLTEKKTLIVHVSKEITEKKQLEKKIRENEKRYRTLFNHAPLGILIIDPETATPVEFNELACADLGYTREEFAKLKVQDYKADRNLSEVNANLDKILRLGKVEFEAKHITKTREIHDVIVTAQPIELSGKTYVQSIYRDVTQAKKIELALMESEKMYRSLVEGAQEGVWALDSNDHTVYVNPKMQQILGYTLDEMLEKPLEDFLDRQDIEQVKQGWAERKTDLREERELVLTRKDGVRIYALVSLSSIMDDHGNFTGTIALVTDITLRKLMEEKLEAYSKNLEETVKQRTAELVEAQAKLVKSERLAAIGQVAAMVGHDLRNPLSGINAATFYLKKKLGCNADPDIKQMLEVIEKDAQYANAIINDLTDYSREIKLEITETNPQKIISESLALFQVPESIRIVNSTQNAPSLFLDTGKMKRVFANFVKNAVEAMPQGGDIYISSCVVGGEVEFKFADGGVGMSREVLDRIWTPFFTTKTRGMGLGLAICKRLIDAHHGSVSVESKVDVGTTFTIKLPVESAKPLAACV